MCDYVQVSGSADSIGLDVRWRVVCAGTTVYGASGGYSYRAHPSWRAGTIVNDSGTTASDGDPSFVWDSRGVTIADDDSGPLGAYTLRLQPI